MDTVGEETGVLRRMAAWILGMFDTHRFPRPGLNMIAVAHLQAITEIKKIARHLRATQAQIYLSLASILVFQRERFRAFSRNMAMLKGVQL